MAAIKIQKFLGAAPKVSAELLPDGAGQVAYNLQLYSGDLIPYSEPAVVDSIPRTGVIKTIYGLYDPDTSTLQWLSWLADVDITTISASSDDEQRFYYTGDGVPKVSNYTLATTGSEPYPLSYYELGLPLPSTTPTAAAVTFSSPTSTHYERDTGNTAIITTAAAHGLRTGNVVTVRGFTGGAVPESFNITNTRITVTSTTTFEYYSAGDAAAEAADTNGVIDLAGSTVTRAYTYTWYTPWLEESIGADPTDTFYLKEGQTVIVSDLPTAAPAGDNFIRGMRLYRTLSTASGTEFYHLSTLWFPLVASKVTRLSNVVTLEMSDAHNLFVGDKFKLGKCTDATFDITGAVVVSVVNATTVTYAQTAGDVSEKAETTGTLYHNVAELEGDTPRYWGDDSVATATIERTSNVATMEMGAAHGLLTNHIVTISGMTDGTFDEADVTITVTGSTTFTYPNTGGDEVNAADTGGTVVNDSYMDDFDYLNLVNILTTEEYDAPHDDMVGLKLVQNNMVVGFFDNQLCFAEPGHPHAWPEKYRRTFEYDIVAVEAVGGYLIVLTEEYAYRVSGSDPFTLSIARIDTPYPCLSKRSVVNMGYGVLYATYGGLAMWTPSTGLSLATKYIHDWDTWDDDIDPTTIVGQFFNDKYFGSYDGGSFIFERDEKIGGYYITAGHQFNSAWQDPADNALYTSSDELGNITQWGSSVWPLRHLEWKSKAIITKGYMNIGAARVVADYTLTDEDTTAYATYNNAVAAFNTAIWVNAEQLGTMNGPTDYIVDTVPILNFGELNRTVVHGDGLTRTARTVPSAYAITFQLWQNKTLAFTTTVTDDSIFRCPAGYKSDTFEVAVAGSARVRAIHLGETPDGLRKA